MDLPQELIDRIIDDLRHDSTSLKSCSLVARSWTPRSQQHLFTAIVIWPDTLRLWRNTITPSPEGISSYVRDLSLQARGGAGGPRFSPALLYLTHQHLASIQRLQVLRLLHWTLVNWECYTRSFGSLSTSLRELQLVEPTSDTTALLLLVTFFSDIERIVIVNPSILSTDTSRVSLPTNLRLRWKIVQFLSFGSRSVTFFQKLAELPEAPSWEELTLGFASDVCRLDVFSRLLSSCSATLRVLRITRAHPDDDSGTHLIPGDITLPPLPRLCEIEFPAAPTATNPLLHGGHLLMDRGSEWLHARLISSITSTQMSMVTVSLEKVSWNFLESEIDWDSVDKAFAVVGRKVCTAGAGPRLVVRFVTFTQELGGKLRSLAEETGWMHRFQKVGTLEVVY